MASLIGLSRAWFHNGSTPHYDVSLRKKAMAIDAGAIEVDRRGMVEIIRRIRNSKSDTGVEIASIDQQLVFTFI